MSESLYPKNPFLSRPAFTGRVSSPLSRPHFPWTTYLHHRPSSASPAPTGASANWDSASTVSNTSQTYTRTPSAIVPQYNEETNMRQWTFTAFEWTVRNVRELRDYVEGIETQNSLEAPSFDESSDGKDGAIPTILKEAPVIGDGKFKLEIGRTSSAEEASAISPPPVATEVAQSIPFLNTFDSSASSAPNNPNATLSLFLTSMQLDWNHGGYEVAATLMAGIKCSEDRPGERCARSEWVWEAWRDWVFCKGSEFWECTMPSLSSLLEKPRISATDSFVICIQVHSPVGPHFPQQPNAFYVPKDLLDGIEASLDNANTGDVQFICLERYDPSAQTLNDPENSSQSTYSLNLTARKRVIYAHSDILARRCDYFATLIASSFAENNSSGGRVMHTIVVEEADFVTIYWLLKWIYADWLLFKDIDDPRAAVDGLGAGWSARWLTGGGGEWDWKTFSPKSGQFEDLDGEDSAARSVASDSMSAGSMASAATNSQARPPTKVINLAPSPAAPRTPSRTVGRRSATGTGPSSSTKNISVSIASTSTRSVPSTSSSSSPSQTQPPQTTSRTSPFPTTLYPLSPSQSRLPPRGQSDPYPHPTPAPAAASALSIYQIAHRYAIPGLQHLAMEHMMNTITPKTAFPLLLASCFWDELHNLVQDYVINQWGEVSRSEEFDTCVLEVSAGEWGSEGGKTLTTLFRRLHSPNQLRLS